MEEQYSLRIKEQFETEGIEITKEIQELLDDIDGYYETCFNRKIERKRINEEITIEIQREIKRLEGIFDKIDESLMRNIQIIEKIEKKEKSMKEKQAIVYLKGEMTKQKSWFRRN